jgi:DNA-binding NarL/FixJ family response regulator
MGHDAPDRVARLTFRSSAAAVISAIDQDAGRTAPARISPKVIFCGALPMIPRPAASRKPPTEAAYQQMKYRTAKPRDWSDAEKRQLAKLVRDGMSTRAISAALGRRASSVKMMAREMKLILRKKAKRPPVRAASGGG